MRWDASGIYDEYMYFLPDILADIDSQIAQAGLKIDHLFDF